MVRAPDPTRSHPLRWTLAIQLEGSRRARKEAAREEVGVFAIRALVAQSYHAAGAYALWPVLRMLCLPRRAGPIATVYVTWVMALCLNVSCSKGGTSSVPGRAL